METIYSVASSYSLLVSLLEKKKKENKIVSFKTEMIRVEEEAQNVSTR